MVFKKATAKYYFEYIDIFDNMTSYACELKEELLKNYIEARV